MNYVKIFFVFIILISSISCNKQETPIKNYLTGNELKVLIEKFLQDDPVAKNKLQGLFTYSAKDFASYNKISIDSIQIDSLKFFSIIVENQIPVYNLFAIVDDKLKLYLKDESLNGFIESEWKKSGSNIYALVNDDFKSNDIIELSRSSLYLFNNHSFDLVFREFSKLKSNDKNLEQNVTLLSDTTIYTEITDNTIPNKKVKKDIFRFDPVKNKYLSKQNFFTNLVHNTVISVTPDSALVQITDYESIKDVLGLEPDSSSKNDLTVLSDADFDIKLSNQWKKVKNYTITNFINKETKGIKFINTKIGASLSLFKTFPQDSAKSYFTQRVENISNDKKFRFSEELEAGKSIFKIFEFSCKSKKIFLMLEAPKSTYENNIEIFDTIIKSFKVNC